MWRLTKAHIQNEIWHWPNNEIGVAVQSSIWVWVELLVWQLTWLEGLNKIQ